MSIVTVQTDKVKTELDKEVAELVIAYDKWRASVVTFNQQSKQQQLALHKWILSLHKRGLSKNRISLHLGITRERVAQMCKSVEGVKDHA